MSWGFDSTYKGLRFRYLPEARIMFDCSSPEFIEAVKNRDERIFEIFEKWIENEPEWCFSEPMLPTISCTLFIPIPV